MSGEEAAREVARLAAALALLACGSSGPRPLVAGQDACEVCRMAITDPRYGGEVVLTTGRHRTFDSIECLADYLASGADSARRAGVFVSDYEHQALIDARTAIYLRGGALRSPMGRELSAFAPGTSSETLRATYGGEVLDWPGVQRAASGALHPTPERDTTRDPAAASR